jgi:hypothetical protein
MGKSDAQPAEKKSWKNFYTGELTPSYAVARRDLSERICPSCGELRLRMYIARFERQHLGPALLTQIWCSKCRKFTGSTGPMPDGLSFTDPLATLSRGERADMSHSVDLLFAELDRCWARGELPQRFL